MSRRDSSKKTVEKEHGIWLTGAYLRISKDDGNDESCSIDHQRKMVQSYIEDHKDLTLVKFYIDDGISGTSEDEREHFQEMLQDIVDGKIRCVLVKDLSRAFRNNADQTRFLEETSVRYDVRFISIRMPFIDTVKHPETLNMLSIGFQGMMNENHCRETSIKVRDVFDVKRRNGLFIGAFAPYGYRKDPADKNRLVIDPQAAGVVRDIYNMFCGGMSKAGITARLNELGIPNPAQYKRQKGLKYRNPHDKQKSALWQPRTVYDILKNQMYLGHMVQGKQRVRSYKVHERVAVPEEEWYIVKNTHEAIIDEAMFRMAQSLMKRDTRTPPQKRELHLFSGFVRCPDCHKAMHRKTAKGIAYYHCRTYEDQSKTSCTKHTIREDKLYDIVLQVIQSQIKLMDHAGEVLHKLDEAPRAESPSHRLNGLLNQHKEQLEKKRAYAKALYTDMKDGLLSKDEYLHYKKDFGEEIGALEKQVEMLEAECRAARGGKTEHPDLTYFRNHKELKTLDRKILSALVDVVLVHEGGQVEIKLHFADQYQRRNGGPLSQNQQQTIPVGCAKRIAAVGPVGPATP